MNTSLHPPSRHAPLALALLALLALGSVPASAARPTIAALQAQINGQAAQIAGHTTQISTLQSQVTAGTIPNVAGYVTMDLSTPTRPTLRVSGANLQVVNGTGSTESANGLGNVLVGYDDVRTGTLPVCSLGTYTDQTSCQNAGYVWAVSHKSGSHNVVVGLKQNYSRYGGLVAGYLNTINGNYASVSGGGYGNASGAYSSVNGGLSNVASGDYSSASGGATNTASGLYSSVSGGANNTASAVSSSVSGGVSNTALGSASSVSGGLNRAATTPDSWAAGGLYQIN